MVNVSEFKTTSCYSQQQKQIINSMIAQGSANAHGAHNKQCNLLNYWPKMRESENNQLLPFVGN